MVAPIPRDETPEAVFASAAQLDSSVPPGLTDFLGAVLASRPAWMRDALCAERPEVNFFPAKGESLERVRWVCASCLVRAECRAWALEQRATLDGIWSGLSPRQRQQYRTSGVLTSPRLEDGATGRLD